MAIEETGLIVQSYESILREIIEEEQKLISKSIDVGDDTGLGQANQIMAQRIALVNEAIQDVYDQRDIQKAEGKALDDNVSWLGITRQAAAATAGEVYFKGDDGTIIASNSFIQNASTLERYTTNTAVVISKNNARELWFSVPIVLNSTLYSVTIQGTAYDYTSDIDATEAEIIAGLVAAVVAAADPDFTATDNLDGTAYIESLSVGGATPRNLILDVGANVKLDSITTAGNVTGVDKGVLPAAANSLTKILSPVAGWDEVNNPLALTIGRERETDGELRLRAIAFQSSAGKATVDSIRAAVLNEAGVSSANVNERYVSQFTDDWKVIIDTAVDSTVYTVTINDEVYTINSGVSATIDSIAQDLVTEINTNNTFPWTATDYTGIESGTLLVSSTTLYTMTITGDANSTVNEGQPAGSIQLVVAGGDDLNAIAQTIWDTKPAGVQVWALNDATLITENVVDENGDAQQISFNQPTSITTTVEIRYKVFDTVKYPSTDTEAYDAVKANIVQFGNLMNAGEDVLASEFEGTVYGSVGGIYDVYIEIIAATTPSAQTSASDDRDAEPITAIILDSSEEIFFDADTITVINDT